jgi:hypothetical protein
MPAIKKLPRRAFLRGLGGVAVALPLLEVMECSHATAASAGAIPKRYVFFYGGISTGTYKSGGGTADLMVPSTVGSGYEITPSLEPIGSFGVQDHVSIVSKLKIPWGDGTALPAGGRTAKFHFATVTPQLSGYRNADRNLPPGGPTSDQVISAQIAADLPSSAPLVYRVQPATYVGSSGGGGITGRISWKDDGSGGLTAVDPIVSPKLAFDSLFANFTDQNASQEALAQAEFELRRRKSVVDLVRARAEALIPKLGTRDKQRMEQHFDEIRALETKLAAIPPVAQGACQKPGDPGEDPPIGGSIIEYEGEGQGYSTTAGYSDEDKRAEVLCDLVRMAFACDLARVAAIQMTMWKCYMNMFQIAGWQSDMHELTHGAGPLESVSDSVKWHVKHLARLTQLLRDTKEVDGSTLLDHSALVMTFEGGHGYDPEGGDYGAHSTENMCVLIAGHAGGLAGGRHVQATDKHPVHVVNTAMNAVGVPGNLGEVSGNIPELLG